MPCLNVLRFRSYSRVTDVISLPQERYFLRKTLYLFKHVHGLFKPKHGPPKLSRR